MPNIIGIIPARYASTRFPGKVLADIYGKSMVQRVYEQAVKSDTLSKVIVATDHEKIYDHVRSFGGEAIMTSTRHESGTDRCKEALDNLNKAFDFVINIQGDEPFIKPEQIDVLAGILNPDIELATLVIKSNDLELLLSPNSAKVIVNKNNEAIYFSRHLIPFVRNFSQEKWVDKFQYLNHIGIYAYRTDILAKITKLTPSPLEVAESLEQLRWIENGFKIKVQETTYENESIDTPEDLERILTLYQGKL